MNGEIYGVNKFHHREPFSVWSREVWRKSHRVGRDKKGESMGQPLCQVTQMGSLRFPFLLLDSAIGDRLNVGALKVER